MKDSFGMLRLLVASPDSPSALSSAFGPDLYWGYLIILLILLLIIAYFLFWKGDDEMDPTASKTEDSNREEEKAASEESTDADPDAKSAEESSASSPDGDAKLTKEDDKLGLLYDSAPDDADDLTKIKGVGATLEKKLNEFGVYKYDQIAGWSEPVVAEFSERLSFKGRVEREKWQEQAKQLADS